MAVIGYVAGTSGAHLDAVLASVAGVLIAEGWHLAGALGDATAPGSMMLRLLPGMQPLCISQTLGALSTGCRLNPQALEAAVGRAGAVLDAAPSAPPTLLIVNRFGKTEAEGRGFRPLIGRALSEGRPVLIAVRPAQMASFAAFTGGMEQALPVNAAPILAWCRTQAAAGKG